MLIEENENPVNTADFPFISVVIPMYNAAYSIQDCLQSVVNIDYPKDKLEIIVVDNGSTDRSVTVAKKFDVILLSETSTHTSYAARNKGILAAHGELIAFTDADCIVTPSWLIEIIKYIPDQSIGCFAGEIEAYQPKTLIEQFSHRWGFLRQNGTLTNPYLPYTQTANSVYRHEVFDKVGLFRSEISSGGDADIAWRMQKELELGIKFIPEALVYHKHRTSLIGLYKQFKKYEIGKKSWLEYYPDFPLPTAEERFKEYEQAKERLKKNWKANWKKYRCKQIDWVDFVSPFLWVLISHATYSVRREERT